MGDLKTKGRCFTILYRPRVKGGKKLSIYTAGGSQSAEKFLEALAEELSIPETRYEQAEKSYKSLGDWFHRPDSTIRQFSPSVYVQGSFGLGTAIRPINDAEEYDVDSVCELKLLSKSDLTQFELKKMVGLEVEAYRKGHAMTKPLREGRRCWILNYADGAQFHMDVLPSLPNAAEQRMLLESAKLDASWTDTAVAITDKDVATYRILTAHWPRSNPKGYSKWFASRMGAVLARRKQLLVESLLKQGVKASVEQMPEYRVRTPLQSAVMLLKRHRDTTFAQDGRYKPISVIISTLSAHAYNQEESISAALASILANMDRFVLHDGQKYQIPNPTDPLENFADRWEKEPQRAQAFFSWLKLARQDFGRVAQATTLDEMNEAVHARLGAGLTERAVKKLGSTSGGGLLRTVSSAAAATATAPSFGNSPRVPTTPKGFA